VLHRPSGPSHSRVVAALARALVWSRYLIIAFWVAVAVASVTWLPTITEARRDSGVDGFVPPKSSTVDTELRSARAFGFPLLSRTVMVQRNPEGLPLLVQAEAVARAARISRGGDGSPLIFGALPVPNTFQLFPGSRESGTTVLTYLFTPPWAGFSEQYGAAQQLVEQTTDPTDSVAGVTGSIPARVEQREIVEESLPLIELATISAIVLIVGVVFRSVVAPVLTVAVAGIALIVTTRAAPVIADAVGVTAPSELEPLYVALVLGVVTDYVIFFLSGLRLQLPRTRSRLLAAQRVTTEVAPIVTVAGLTVAAGTAALVVARSELFRAFGPGMALAVLVGLAVSVTLTPALLAVLGRFALWPAYPRPQADRDEQTAADRRRRHARPGSWFFNLLTRPRAAALVLTVTVLGLAVAALPLRGLSLGLSFVPSLPESSPVAAAAAEAKHGFADGILSPTLILVEGEAVVEDRPALARFGQLLREQPGVAGVAGPGLLPADVEAQGALLSRSGDSARYLVVLDDSPLSAEAIDTLSGLRAAAPGLTARAGLDQVRIGFGGDTSLGAEIVTATTADLIRIALAALAANLLMLVIFLRALVAPLYLLASSVLALAASLGMATFLFQDVLGHDGLTFYVPFAAAVLLVALGSDYNIFGIGQVWKVAESRPLREAVRVAMPQSTKAITSAGITLAVSFGLLALVPLRPFQELAFAMSVGILIDVFVVRSLLVPALLTLIGKAGGRAKSELRSAGDNRRRDRGTYLQGADPRQRPLPARAGHAPPALRSRDGSASGCSPAALREGADR